MESVRAFVALWPPAEFQAAIRKTQRQIQLGISGTEVRWVNPAQVHLTLSFLGEVASDSLPALTEALAAALCQKDVPRLTIEKAGCFPNSSSPRVVWAGLSGDLAALVDLRNAVALAARGVGSHEETQPFRPHLTIGRLRLQRRNSLFTSDLDSALSRVGLLGEWSPSGAELISSQLTPQGPVYRTLRSFSLKMENG